MTRSRVRWRLPEGEGFNLATASAGLLLAIPGAMWLVARAPTTLAAWTLGGYGASLVLLFAATLLHHANPASVALRRLDHASVYAAIVGTCAPFCLLVAPGPASYACLAVVGALCAAGVALKLLAPFTSDGRNLWLYLP
ncbi:MAG TPA: hemolysin III family protein, partial [Candidatus Thermoplasmatota archaeon]|nr:hemolysin III family protein [Candidatus Thermoplasmatota archaeon]